MVARRLVSVAVIGMELHGVVDRLVGIEVGESLLKIRPERLVRREIVLNEPVHRSIGLRQKGGEVTISRSDPVMQVETVPNNVKPIADHVPL